jgi:subtilisin-like proprotein convertase family protein
VPLDGEDIAGTFPTTLTPIDTISSVGRQAMDGNWVLRVEDVDVGPLVREGVLNAWGLAYL